VYLSGSGRETTLKKKWISTSGRGGDRGEGGEVQDRRRMSDNRDASPGRTNQLLELAQKKLGGKVTLMADANGSYDAANAIAMGKRLQEMKYLWFEERSVGRAERNQEGCRRAGDEGGFRRAGYQPVAVQWMIENKVMDVCSRPELQRRIHTRGARGPDGAQGEHVDLPAQHADQRGSVNILQFAATTPNIGPYMEYVWRAPARKESWYSPISRSRTG